MNFRRYYIPDSIIFITQVVQGRHSVFKNNDHMILLQSTLRQVKGIHPFRMLGYVFLPDHFHLLIRPSGKSNFSQIMHSLKRNFTVAYKDATGVNGSMKFWQKRFFDHVIRNENDLATHLDYIHYNPVKHQLVAKPEDWQYSSFLAWRDRGAYPEQWGWNMPDALNGLDFE